MERARTIRASGIEFHARQSGEQPRAVFLHGFGGDLHTWDGVWAELGESLPALRYDLRGFGRSIDDSGEPFDHAEDLLAILDATGIQCADVIGVSMGGGVALNFALEYPARVRNLVLISPAMVAWEWSDDWRTLWRPIVAKAREGDMDAARQLWWRHPLFETTRSIEDAATALFESIMRFSGAQWLGENHRRVLPDVERLHTLRARTLLLTGARDQPDFRLIADLIEAGVPEIRRIDLPGAGHLLNLEDPRRCAREILAFLQSAAQR